MLAVLVFGVTAALVPAGATAASVFKVTCNYSHSRSADPIVSPGVYPSAHLHDFYSNPTTDENSTLNSLQKADGNCKGEPLNHSAYWTPTLSVDGQTVHAPKVIAYYSRGRGPRTETLPAGLELLAGSAHSTGPQPISVVSWSCTGADVTPQDHPFDCTPYHTQVQYTVRFPSCWDGNSLNPSSLVYAGNKGNCPSSNPHILPHIRLTFLTGVADPRRLAFSSGPYYTAHADVFDAWDQARLNQLLCAAGVTC